MDEEWFGEWSQRQVDRADDHVSRQSEWERRLLSDDEARWRRLLDDEERRMSSVFDVDDMEASEPAQGVVWP